MRGGRRYRAGRPGWKNKVEDCRHIDVRRWAREGLLTVNNFFVCRWTRGGEQIASIGVRVNSPDLLTLKYYQRDDGDNCGDVSLPIQLKRTPCYFGGERVWFSCPDCGRKCAVLYLTRKGWFCRRSLNLAYESQSENAVERMHRRIAKLGKKLGDDYSKPKGMRWKTYNRIIDKLSDIESKLDFAFLQRAAKLLGENL